MTTSTSGQIFLDKVVLLSSAVADADNHVMMHGRKLELLAAMDQLLPALTKTEVTTAQKKIEDLCLRILFQNCPHILVRPIVSVLSQLYSRGTNSSMHGCVAFLLQLSVHNPKDSAAKLDRPVPGLDEDESAHRFLSIHEKSVCLSVAVGIIVGRGPSASYFVPNILVAIQRHTKLAEPAARENAMKLLHSVIDVIGVPGTTLGTDLWKNVIYRCVYTEKSPQVRIASAYALAAFIAKCKPVAIANIETMQGICLKVLLSPSDQLKEQGLMGALLVEARQTHANMFVELLVAGIRSPSEKKESDGINSKTHLPNQHTNIKSVRDFASALGLLSGLTKKYKSYAHAVEALGTTAIRLVLTLGSREEDLALLTRVMVLQVAAISPSVATRCVNRVLRACEGDSAVLRLVSEVLIPIVRARDSGEQSVCVSLSGMVECMAIVEGSITALDCDLATELVALLSRSSLPIAVNAAYALRALCRVVPSHSFTLVNVLLNHITIQNAELMGSIEPTCSAIFVKYIQHYALGLASIMCECAGQLPQDVTAGIFSTAMSLVEPDSVESDQVASSVVSQKRSCGFILLVPIVVSKPEVVSLRIVPLLAMWKLVLGRKAKDALTKVIAPGAIISDIHSVMENLQTVSLAMKVVSEFLAYCKATLAAQPDTCRIIVSFLNNVWQLCQLALPLEQSTASTTPAVSILVNAIRVELYRSLLAMDAADIDSMLKPLVAYLSAETMKDSALGMYGSQGRIFSSSIVDQVVGDLTGSGSFLANAIIDSADPILEEIGEHEYLLGQAVTWNLRILSPAGNHSHPLPVRDYFASSLAAGSLEEFYSIFPASSGSPYCPLLPYVPVGLNSLAPMSSQMRHPVLDQKIFSILLLSKLLVLVDSSLFDACVNVLHAGYRAVEQVSSTEYENLATSKETELIESRAIAVCQSNHLTVVAICALFTRTFLELHAGKIADHSATNVLTLAASPVGLGALHPLTRRVNALVIASVYASKNSLRDIIFQCVTDSTVSTVSRTRAATATLIGFIVQLQSGSLDTFANPLFRLSRELSLPIRSCCLFAIQAVCASAKNLLAPWSREVLKVTMAHAVADVYPSVEASLLLSAIINGIWQVSSISPQEAHKCDLLWNELRLNGLVGSVNVVSQNRAFSVGIERLCICFASQAAQARRHVEYVVNEISNSAELYSATCKTALIGLTEIAEQKAAIPTQNLLDEIYDTLFEVSDVNPQLRKSVNQVLKVLIRAHGVQALPHILASLGRASGQILDVSPTSDTREDDVEEDEYGSETEDQPNPTTVSRWKNRTASGGIGRKKVSASLSTRSLMIKCLKRIFKSHGFRKEDCLGSLDKVINIAVSSVSGGTDSNPALAIQGIKLLLLLIETYADMVDQKTVTRKRVMTDEDSPVNDPTSSDGPSPLLLQFETQILTAVRKGVKINSDASTVVQKYSLRALRVMIEKGLTTCEEKLIELLVQPLVIIDPPATMPWSTYFAIREAGNTVVSGRTILSQTNEQDQALVLWTRMEVIVDLLDLAYTTTLTGNVSHTQVTTDMLKKHGLFIHYFLMRMLMDCSIAINCQEGLKSSTHLFSVLASDVPSMVPSVRSLLIPTVLNGLALTRFLEWGHLEPPHDCPISDQLDVDALYCGLMADAAANPDLSRDLGRFTRPAEIVAFDMGYDKVMNVFDLVQTNQNAKPDFKLVWLAHQLISDQKYQGFVAGRAGTVWNMCRCGGLGRAYSADELLTRKIGDIVQWLVKCGFFSSADRANELVAECLFPLVRKQPQIIVKTLRDCEIENVTVCIVLLDAIDFLFKTAEASTIQFAIVLLIPVFSRLQSLIAENDSDESDIPSSLVRLRESLVHAAQSGLSHAVTQCMSKLFTGPGEPLVITVELMLPVVLELLQVDAPAAIPLIIPLANQFASHKDAPEWEQIVKLVLGLGDLASEATEEVTAKSIIACMQPVEVFKAALNGLEPDHKSKVEMMVRKFIPRKEPALATTSEEQGDHPASAVTSAPQIQLKLKFGK